MELGNEAKCYRDTWAEVNLDNIACNVQAVKAQLKPHVKLMAVVKSNAYGHGALQVAEVALREGAEYLGVATLDEALQLRCNKIQAPILVLGHVASEHAFVAAKHGITLTVVSRNHAEQLSHAVQSFTGHILKVHLKIDTGMGRLGVRDEHELMSVVRSLAHPAIHIEGAFTHFAQADSSDQSYSKVQLDTANALFGRLKNTLERPERFILHAANSAGIIQLSESHLNMVRLGISLYGVYPSLEVDRNKIRLRQALTLYSRIVHIKDVPAGTSIGYGSTFVTERPSTKVATVPIGYGDGLPRSLSNLGYFLVRGTKCPILGRVCMDQVMIDVTHALDVEEGDLVTVYNQETLEQLSALAGTIPYELLCAISARVVRTYVHGAHHVSSTPSPETPSCLSQRVPQGQQLIDAASVGATLARD